MPEPAARTRRVLLLAASLLSGAVLARAACSRAGDGAGAASGGVPAAPTPTATPQPDAGAPGVAPAVPVARVPAALPSRATALRETQAFQRAQTLLADIERRLKRDPPAEVHALIAAQRSGAGREELLERARRELPKDFALRGLVVRWINDVAPDPNAPKPAAAPTTPRPGGRWLTPIHPVEPR